MYSASVEKIFSKLILSKLKIYIYFAGVAVIYSEMCFKLLLICVANTL